MGKYITEETQWGGVPERMRPGIIRYVEQGVIPGEFLTAVITNDLKNAVLRADDENVNLLLEYVKFFYNWVPAACWGSQANMAGWIDLVTNKNRDPAHGSPEDI